MLDFNLTSLTETNRILRQIAEALERAYPPPAQPAAKKPRTIEDLMVTNDETLADIEDEEERKRAVMEEKD
jgi:hypothetical protein